MYHCLNLLAWKQLKKGMKHLTVAALTVIKSIESNATTNVPCFPTRKRPAPNSNAEKKNSLQVYKKETYVLSFIVVQTR